MNEDLDESTLDSAASICARCVYLHGGAVRDPYWRWLCMQAPRAQTFSYVSGKEEGEPYHRCERINFAGSCPQYRKGSNCLSKPALKKVPGPDNAWEKIEEIT